MDVDGTGCLDARNLETEASFDQQRMPRSLLAAFPSNHLLLVIASVTTGVRIDESTDDDSLVAHFLPYAAR